MAAAVETMFYTREKPWHGLGIRVENAPDSKEALELAGLDWQVVQEPIFSTSGVEIPGYKANVRDSDSKVLGIVSDRYKIIQNSEAFSFTDMLIGEGVRYETAGSLFGGRKVWMLAKLPQEYIITGERISPYLVFTNTHDGSGAVRCAVTPIRVVCSNTLNLALSSAERSWSMIHTGDIQHKLEDARDTLLHAGEYMEKLGEEIERLREIKLTEQQVCDYIDALIPESKSDSLGRRRNIKRNKAGIVQRYLEAPDLKRMGHNAYRFINAVSDFATHADPLRRTKDYRSNMFNRTIEGNPLIDRAYQIISAA